VDVDVVGMSQTQGEEYELSGYGRKKTEPFALLHGR
jgi:hypothetical protein